jgi:hypothetical protein
MSDDEMKAERFQMLVVRKLLLAICGGAKTARAFAIGKFLY